MFTSTPLPALAAWLHIGPNDDDASPDDAPIGVQRLHVAEVSEKLRHNRVSIGFLPSHLATDITTSIIAITGDDDWQDLHALVLDCLRTGENFRLSIGGGMFATVFPAEPTSGVNLRPNSAPIDTRDMFTPEV